MNQLVTMGGTQGADEREKGPSMMGFFDESHEVVEPPKVILLQMEKTDGTTVPADLLTEKRVQEYLISRFDIDVQKIVVVGHSEAIIVLGEEVDPERVALLLRGDANFRGVPVSMSCAVKHLDWALEYMELVQGRKREKPKPVTSTEAEKVPDVAGVDIPTPTSESSNQPGRDNEETPEEMVDRLTEQMLNRLREAHKTENKNSNTRIKIVELEEESKDKKNNKAPRLSTFDGEKGEDSSTFEQWSFEVLTYKKTHTEKAMMEAILRSLKGTPANTIRFLGPEATVDKVLEKLAKVYGSVATSDVMFSNLYRLQQGATETVQTFAGRVEEAVNNIRVHFPKLMTEEQANANLKDRLFGGFRIGLRDSLRYLNDNPEVDYTKLMVAARKSEAEASLTNENTDKSKSGSHTKVQGKSGMSNLLQDIQEKADEEWMRDQVKYVIDNMVKDNKFGLKGKQNKSYNGKGGGSQKSSSKGPTYYKDGKKIPKCYRCGGYGHISTNCPSESDVLNYVRGEGSSPPSQNTKQESSQKVAPAKDSMVSNQ